MSEPLDLGALEGHTPGPWVFEDSAISYAEIICGEDENVCDWDGNGRSDQPEKTDGRLMAAAPDLLALLREALGELKDAIIFIKSHDEVMDNYDDEEARALLARVRGWETP